MSHLISVRLMTLSLLALSAISMSACTNTVDGAGQDIERAGEKIQENVH